MTPLDMYQKQFTKLNANKNPQRWTAATTFRAPHKPILLLAVLDLFAQGSISTNLIELTPELIELFGLYWHKIRPPSQRGNIAYPFYYLKSEGFWHLLPQLGQEVALAVYRPNAGLTALHKLIVGARLDDELYELMEVTTARDQLRTTLLATYFAPELHPILLEQSVLNAAAYQYSLSLLSQAHQTLKETTANFETVAEPVRDQGFRKVIVKIYDHRCALCGIRIMTADGHTAIAAAHIIPWSISHNDNPRNGLALCHLCHWAFDEGLVTFSDDYRTRLSPQLPTAPNLPGQFMTFSGRKLLGPAATELWPFVESMQWHRHKVFRTHPY